MKHQSKLTDAKIKNIENLFAQIETSLRLIKTEGTVIKKGNKFIANPQLQVLSKSFCRLEKQLKKFGIVPECSGGSVKG